MRRSDINKRDDNDRTALMFAAINAHGETMKVLLDHVAEVNARSKQGGTALIRAAFAGDLRMVQALLDKGADVHARLLQTDESAMTIAAKHGYDEIATLLCQID